ncbi:FAD dependent oxidoreductase [Tricladium varicosporioides]|nr:FAD dependent oxidoreductase [Hymenoscyphus varicosporioides]
MIASNEDLKGAILPSAPIPRPCLSYWQRTTRGYRHLNSNQTTNVPKESKYVVIGSGISGALTAFELTENGIRGEDIVIIEAREAASGASSRNAGHVRPDAFRGFKHYSSLHGPEQAQKIIANERVVLDKVEEFVKKHNVPCDFNLTTTFDVCMTPEFVKYEAESFEGFKEAGGDVSHVKFYEKEEAQKKTRVKGALAAYEWPAGSSHPAKLAQWLLNAAIERGATLFTHCPVSKISEGTSKGMWDILTPRGIITTSTVFHCTNAYASLLLPQLSRYLTPNRAQAHTLVAPPAFSGEGLLTNTFSLRYGLNHFYSLIQRKGDGTLVLGVSRTNPTLSTETLREIVQFDDSKYNEEIVEDALKQWQILFPEKDQGVSATGIHGEGLEHAWTGIIGMTGDSVPFVGPVDGLDGQWICAGFGGHGMARIFTCAPGVVKLVLGKPWSDTGLPECFQLGKERLSKLQNLQKSP